MVNFGGRAGEPAGASGLGILWFTITAILLALGFLSWSTRRSLDRVGRERKQVEALMDSLHAQQLTDARMRSMEQRLDAIERDLTFASRAARLPDVIALRDWARRLDARSLANSRGLAGVEGRLDSLWAVGAGRDSVASRD